MRRDELRHLIRAACRVTDEQHVIVMGSQAILGSWKEIAAPDRVTMSNEADIAFFNDPEEMKADTVMGVLGLDSQFHETFGVYADGITADSPILCPGWPERLIPLVVEDADLVFVGWCLDPTDLCVSKMAAGRPKDHEFVEALVAASLVDPDRVAVALGKTSVRQEVLAVATGLLAAWRTRHWDVTRGQQVERRRRDAVRDLRSQCPFDAPPQIEYPPRCGAGTRKGPCGQLRGQCQVHRTPVVDAHV